MALRGPFIAVVLWCSWQEHQSEYKRYSRGENDSRLTVYDWDTVDYPYDHAPGGHVILDTGMVVTVGWSKSYHIRSRG